MGYNGVDIIHQIFSGGLDMKKRLMAIMVCFSLVLGMFYLVPAKSAKAAELSKNRMETVLKKVKYKIDLPKELSEFSYDYYQSDYDDEETWNFWWYDEQYDSQLSVTADEEGRIENYSLYASKREKGVNYLPEELLPMAKAAVKKLFPEAADEAEYEDYSCGGGSNPTIGFIFKRVHQGLTVAGNSIYISLSAASGVVDYAYATWTYDAKFPSVKPDYTLEEAKEMILDELNLHLEHYEDESFYDENAVEKTTKIVYVADRTEVDVDAHKAENMMPFNKRGGESYPAPKAEEAYAEVSGAADGYVNDEGWREVELSEQEQEELNAIPNLISKEKAISIATSNDAFYHDEKATQIKARIQRGWRSEDDFVWFVTRTDPTPVNYEIGDWYRANEEMQIDARTGEIVEYSASTMNYYNMPDEKANNPVKKFGKKECRKIFEDFLEKENPDRFAESQISYQDSNYDVMKYVNDKPVYSGYSFSYSRESDDIPYTSNYLNGTVDARYGKITSYYWYWTDGVKFEKAENLLTSDEAAAKYFEYAGVELAFVEDVDWINNERCTRMRLVYHTELAPSIIGAKTGEHYNWGCTPYVEHHPGEFSDISGHKYEREIRILAAMMIIPDDEKFHPDRAATEGEVEQWLRGISYGWNYEEGSGAKCTREMAAKLATQRLGYEELAKKSEIFKTGYSDQKKISKDCLGSVAICKGLEILGAKKGSSFKPKKYITRAEAAKLVVETMKYSNDFYW